MKGAFGIELLANREISEIQNPIFGSSAMILGVLAEILQLLKCTTSQHLYNPSLQSQEVNTESTTRSTYLYNLIQTHSRFSPATSLRWPRHHGHQSATQAPATIDFNKITTQAGIYHTHTYIYKYYISPEIAAWSVDLKNTHTNPKPPIISPSLTVVVL